MRISRIGLPFGLALAVLLATGLPQAQAQAQIEGEVQAQTETPAEAPQPTWPADARLPEKWDWIQLTSNEWLKGEIIAMYDDSLEFDSDELDILSFDWEDIQQIRSAQVMQVGLVQGPVMVGKLHLKGDTAWVLGEEEHKIERSEIMTVVAGEPKEINYWSGKISLGGNVRTGNSEIKEVNATVRILRRTAKNRISIDYLGNYNITEGIEASNNHRASVKWDMFINDRLFVSPIFVEYYSDPFQNIAHQETVGVGVGYEIVNTPKIDWEVNGGPAYQRKTFDSVQPPADLTENTPALVMGTVFDLEVSSAVDFFYEYRFQIVNEVAGTYNHHMVTGLETELTSLLDFDIQIVWDRVQDPIPDALGVVPEQDDFRLIFGLGIDF